MQSEYQNKSQILANGSNLSALGDLLKHLPNTALMPMLFVGHGSPMNGITNNLFSQTWVKVGENLPKPQAILCISAHWQTLGTAITAMPNPRTIHDFYGFPQALYALQYPAHGDPTLAYDLKQILDPLLAPAALHLDEMWGLDHGTWSVLRHIYPKANVPVLQLSLDRTKSPLAHYELAKTLSILRHKGVLIVGSGNIVHNLGMIDFERMDSSYGYDWAIEAQQMVNQALREGDHQRLIDYHKQGRSFSLAVPTPEHFLPLLYILRLQNDKDQLTLFNDQLVGGSLSMTSCSVSAEPNGWL